MTKNSTKRAFLLSVLSIAVCLTMLIGTTFAWFTDTATTGVNVIKSGNLEIGFEYAEGTEVPASAAWKNAEGASIFNYEKWEPGYTVAKHIKITNKGTLAFKYELDFMLSSPVGKLAEVIDVYFADGGKQVADRATVDTLQKVGTLKEFLENTASNPENGELLEGESDIVTIVLKMQESAGNIYQNETVGEGLTIAIFATQYTYEKDSFDNQYDKDAPTLVMIGDTQYATLDAAIDAAKNGDTIKLSGKFTLPTISNKTLTFTTTDKDNTAVIGIGKNVTAAGSTLTFDGVTIQGCEQEDSYHTVQLNNAVKVTYKDCKIKGLISVYCNSDFVNCVFENTFVDQYSVFVYGASVVNVNNCTFNTLCSKAIKLYNEGANEKTLNVTNCTFVTETVDKAAIEIDSTYATKYIVNIKDCTIKGAYQKLWNDKSTKSIVTVNGKREIEIANGLYYDNESTYTVVSAEGMFNFAKQVNESNNNFAGKTVALANDIDLENKAWTPIGNVNDYFSGTFDGNSKTISNLNINNSDNGGNAATGLFGWAYPSATIKNLTIDTAKVAGHHWVGVIAGYTYGTIENCTVKKATVSSTYSNDDADGDKAGLITGYLGVNTGIVKNCVGADSTVSACRDAGQFVGCTPATNADNVTGTATNVTVSHNGVGSGANINNALIGRKS